MHSEITSSFFPKSKLKSIPTLFSKEQVGTQAIHGRSPIFFPFGLNPSRYILNTDVWVCTWQMAAWQRRIPSLPKSTQKKNVPSTTGPGEKHSEAVQAEAGSFWFHLSAVVVVSFEVASFSLGRSSGSHQHRRNYHPQPPWGSSRRGHPPTAGAGPCWDQAHQRRRGEKPADSCIWPLPH